MTGTPKKAGQNKGEEDIFAQLIMIRIMARYPEKGNFYLLSVVADYFRFTGCTE